MAKYIDREALVEWLKRIPLKDLSDGLGLCRVIMEDDFKKAIKKMPKGIVADVAPVVRCKDCEYSYDISGRRRCSHGICCGRAVPPYFYCAEGKERSLTNDSGGSNNA